MLREKLDKLEKINERAAGRVYLSLSLIDSPAVGTREHSITFSCLADHQS